MSPVAEVTPRRDLLAHVDRYFAALGANDPSSFAFAPDGRFSENGQVLRLGEGLWANASGTPSPFLIAADERTGQAAVLTVVSDAGEPAVLGARLSVQSDQVAELETIVCRRSGAIFGPAGFAQPDEIYVGEQAPSQRRPREELVAIVDGYFDAIENSDASSLSVSDECVRRENGLPTTSVSAFPEGLPEGLVRLFAMSVSEQINERTLSFITNVPERRYPVVDEARGIVVAVVVFHIPGGMKGVTLSDGYELAFPPFAADTSSMLMLEAFHVTDGTIDRIDAAFDFFPYGIQSAWGS